MNNPDLQFDQVHTFKKRMQLQNMMQKVASETLANFPKLDRLNKCPCCLDNAINFYAEKFGYNLDKCNICGHIFTNPMPSSEALDYYYNSPFKDFENEFFMQSFDARLPIFTQRIELLINIGVGKNILDIGTAVGIFLEANKLYAQKFNIDACDLNASSCAFLREKYPDVKVINENVLNLERADYDAVTLWDTFEHIPKVSHLLSAVKRQLRTKGLFIFSTPNTASLEWRVMDTEHVQLLPPGHVNLYNTYNINKLLLRNGFETLSVSTLNPSLDLSYLKNRFESEKNLDSKEKRFIFEMYKLLDDCKISEVVVAKLRENKSAGNMVVVARKTS